MSSPYVALTYGETARLAGADVGSLTLVSGLAAFSDQNKDGERKAHLLDKPDKRVDVSENGDVLICSLDASTRVITHTDPAPKQKSPAKKK